MRKKPPIQPHPLAPSLEGKRVRVWYQWSVYYSIPLLGILFFTVFGFVFLRSEELSDWQSVFVLAAKRLQARQPIHLLGGNYNYPPAMAMLSLPLANFPPSASLFGWYLVNVVATTTAFVCAWRLAGGPALIGLAGRWQTIFLISVILAGRFFVAPLENRQFDMVIAALLFAGCHELWRGRELTGAACLGASAAMKWTPLLFAAYLLWRRKFRAAAVLVTVAAILNLLPDFLWPQREGGSYLRDWFVVSLAQVDRFNPGQWFSDLLLNLSLAGLFNRFVSLGLPLSSEQFTVTRAVLPEWRPLLLMVLVYGTGFLLLVITAWRFGKPGTAAPLQNLAPPGSVPLEGLRTPMESAAIVCLMLLLSPMSSKSHYVVLLLPSIVLARFAVERNPARIRVLLLPLLVTGPLTAKGLLGKAMGDLALAWGLPTWFALFSLLGMWWCLGDIRSQRLISGE